MNSITKLFSQNWSEVTGGERNEIVFERLNKTYGAYEIRTHYDHTLLKVFSGGGLFILLISALLLFSNSNPIKKLNPPISDTTVFVHHEEEKKDPIDHEDRKYKEPKKEPTKDDYPVVEKDTAPAPDTAKTPALNPKPFNGTASDSGKATIDGPIGTGKKTTPVDLNPTVDGMFMTDGEKPEFPGGDEFMRKFLQKTLIYPEYIVEIRGKGVVNVGFVIDKDGSVIEVTILNGCKYPELNNEALRVVKKMPKWNPGKQQGNPVKVRMNLPIRFDLKQ